MNVIILVSCFDFRLTACVYQARKRWVWWFIVA